MSLSKLNGTFIVRERNRGCWVAMDVSDGKIITSIDNDPIFDVGSIESPMEIGGKMIS